MSSTSIHTRVSGALRRRIVATAMAAVTLSGVAIIGGAVPAQARPRTCNDLFATLEFFELAMSDNTISASTYWQYDRSWYRTEAQIEAQHC